MVEAHVGSRMPSHAYLILAHNNFYNLEKLILLLDDRRNDIYVHIDKKARNFDFRRFGSLPTKSRVIFTPRISVSWGGFSVVQSELILLKAAMAGRYDYYHLLSGADLPIKTQDDIHTFFENQDGKEFVRFVSDWDPDRVAKYYPFSNVLHTGGVPAAAGRIVNRSVVAVQRKLKYDRLAGRSEPVKKGTQWFSISHALATFVVANTKKIDYFRHSVCSDEHFMQTLLFNSEFYGALYSKTENDWSACMRLIDWKRGSPYIFRASDLASLMGSDMLFARKFDGDVDRTVIDLVYDVVQGQQSLPLIRE